MENNTKKKENKLSLVNVISTAIRIPGVRVDRNSFLREQFSDVSPELLQLIIDMGPVEAKYSRSDLRKMARKLIHKKTLVCTGASFLAGIPGGFAMAATIPADLLQFYGVALALAQEIAYLYGEGDLWSGDMPDTEKVTNQLILYCGVMLGTSGAAQTIRVLSSNLAKQALKKLPQKALTKTFYYPIIKSIAKALGAKMTKNVFAKGVSKVIPVVGGFVSGGVTFAIFPSMGMRLTNALDEAHYSYSDADFESDWSNIIETCENNKEYTTQNTSDDIVIEKNETPSTNVFEKIQEAKKMLDAEIINDEEFSEIKAKLISQM